MSIDLEAIPDGAIEAAAIALHRALVYPVGDGHSEHWAMYADTYRELARVGLAAAAPLLRAPLVAEVARLRVIVEAVDSALRGKDFCAVDSIRAKLARDVLERAALSPSTPLGEPSVDNWKAAETAAAQPGNEPRDLMAALRASVERAKAERTRPSGVGE